MASMINGKNVNELRDFFQVLDDLTEEEKLQIEKENIFEQAARTKKIVYCYNECGCSSDVLCSDFAWLARRFNSALRFLRCHGQII